MQIPPGIILFIGLQFILPDSPRWLIRHNRDEDAKAAFTQIRGDLSGADLHKEFDDMREQILYEKVIRQKCVDFSVTETLCSVNRAIEL